MSSYPFTRQGAPKISKKIPRNRYATTDLRNHASYMFGTNVIRTLQYRWGPRLPPLAVDSGNYFSGCAVQFRFTAADAMTLPWTRKVSKDGCSQFSNDSCRGLALLGVGFNAFFWLLQPLLGWVQDFVIHTVHKHMSTDLTIASGTRIVFMHLTAQTIGEDIPKL